MIYVICDMREMGLTLSLPPETERERTGCIIPVGLTSHLRKGRETHPHPARVRAREV